MSDLNDPRVLFAAERTLLAWSRTATGLMAIGLFIERTGPTKASSSLASNIALWLGAAFVLLGVLICFLSIFHYRRAITSLRPIEIPNNYWVNMSAHVTLLAGLLGIVLTAYILFTK